MMRTSEETMALARSAGREWRHYNRKRVDLRPTEVHLDERMAHSERERH